MPEQTFPGSIVHNALLKTGVIATYRILEGRINLAGPGNAVPNLASEGVLGRMLHQACDPRARDRCDGSEIDQGAYFMPDAHAALHRIAGAVEDIHGLAFAALNPGGPSPSI